MGSLRTAAGKTGGTRARKARAGYSLLRLALVEALQASPYREVDLEPAREPMGSGNTGVWIAIADRMMFTIQSDGTVVGLKAPPVPFQKLMRQPH